MPYVPFFPLGGFTPLQSSALSEVAARLGAKPMQVALAWLMAVLIAVGWLLPAAAGHTADVAAASPAFATDLSNNIANTTLGDEGATPTRYLAAGFATDAARPHSLPGRSRGYPRRPPQTRT